MISILSLSSPRVISDMLLMKSNKINFLAKCLRKRLHFLNKWRYSKEQQNRLRKHHLELKPACSSETLCIIKRTELYLLQVLLPFPKMYPCPSSTQHQDGGSCSLHSHLGKMAVHLGNPCLSLRDIRHFVLSQVISCLPTAWTPGAPMALLLAFTILSWFISMSVLPASP